MSLGQVNFDIRQKINNNSNFLIVSHVSPDGDAVGSALMLYWMLMALGKSAKIWFHDTPDSKYNFVPGFSIIQVIGSSPPVESFDVVFAVDVRNPNLIGFILPMGDIINIDHRSTNTNFGDINYVDTNACAAAEMIYRITYQYSQFGLNLCTAMYLAIFADTAWFRNSLTDEHTFNMASKAVTEGVNPATVAYALC